MIKKLQKLKAKKGFTLVELIVVIAIIGVLAAILVPTMLGYVQSSRVTAADQVAKTIKDAAQVCATEMDTIGKGLTAKTFFAVGEYKTASDGKKAASIENNKIGEGSADYYKGMSPSATDASTHAEKLEKSLTTLLTEAKDGSFAVVYSNGTCIAAYWSEDVTMATMKSYLDASGTFTAWSSDATPGVIKSSGAIVGSNPKYNG